MNRKRINPHLMVIEKLLARSPDLQKLETLTGWKFVFDKSEEQFTVNNINNEQYNVIMSKLNWNTWSKFRLVQNQVIITLEDMLTVFEFLDSESKVEWDFTPLQLQSTLSCLKEHISFVQYFKTKITIIESGICIETRDQIALYDLIPAKILTKHSKDKFLISCNQIGNLDIWFNQLFPEVQSKTAGVFLRFRNYLQTNYKVIVSWSRENVYREGKRMLEEYEIFLLIEVLQLDPFFDLLSPHKVPDENKYEISERNVEEIWEQYISAPFERKELDKHLHLVMPVNDIQSLIKDYII